jgi:hypothetical protein
MKYSHLSLMHVGTILCIGCKTQGSGYLRPTKPTRHHPSQHHLLVHMKSHLRYLWGLQEPGFCSGRGMGGEHLVHSFLGCYAHNLVTSHDSYSYTYHIPLYCIYFLLSQS